MEKLVVQGEYDNQKLREQSKKEQSLWMWLILLGCFLFQMLPYCVALNLTNVFATTWTKWLGGNITLMSLTFTVGALSAAFVGPSIAKMFSKKINMRLVYAIGVITAMAGFFGSSINAFVGGDHKDKAVVAAILWISNILSQAGVMIFSGLGVNNLISKWWPAERRGFALGIAFMGGSLGNIWMQQLVGLLNDKYGTPTKSIHFSSTEWVPYLVMAAIGLVGGLLIVAFACRKPIPPIPQDPLMSEKEQKVIKSQCIGCSSEIEVNGKAASNQKPLEASPLVTQKYPVYWILGVGYLILQMGTIHASMNGNMIANSTCLHTTTSYNSIMSLGGTLFGVSCLIGNFMGGVLNDKIGPHRSIAIAGLGQVAAILCLMLSVKSYALVYVYFILAGLSVYVYTSTPSFISGKLYGAGQSNAHMGILGIFIAVGFAIVNSITGALTGDANAENIQHMFGEETYGNIQNLGIFAIVCMGVGTIIVVICVTMTMNKGIKGLIEYSPTKYSRIVFKYSAQIKVAINRIAIFKKDFRKEEKAIEKYNAKVAKLDAAKQNAKLQKDVEKINAQIEKSKVKLDKKLESIKAKLQKTSDTPINESKQQANVAKADKKVSVLNQKMDKFKQTEFKTDWARYKKEYELVDKINYVNGLRTKLQDEKDQKIAGFNKKLQVQQYIYQYNVGKLKEGAQLLEQYYSNPYAHYYLLIDKALQNKFDRKVEAMKHNVAGKQNKYNKILALEKQLNLNANQDQVKK